MRPSYQRDFVWKEPKCSKLVETILLQLPLQEVWLHEQQNLDFEVIDGQQRLTTILAFERGRFDDGSPFTLQVSAGKLQSCQLHSLISVIKQHFICAQQARVTPISNFSL